MRFCCHSSPKVRTSAPPPVRAQGFVLRTVAMADLIVFRHAAPSARIEPTVVWAEPGRFMLLGCVDAALSPAWLAHNQVTRIWGGLV